MAPLAYAVQARYIPSLSNWIAVSLSPIWTIVKTSELEGDLAPCGSAATATSPRDAERASAIDSATSGEGSTQTTRPASPAVALLSAGMIARTLASVANDVPSSCRSRSAQAAARTAAKQHATTAFIAPPCKYDRGKDRRGIALRPPAGVMPRPARKRPS